jgi:hypothetical protein
MHLPRIVLCLCILISSVGLAQAPEEAAPIVPTAPTGAPPSESSPRGELIPRELEPVDASRGVPRPARIILELAGGAVGGALMTVATFPTIDKLCPREDCLGTIYLVGLTGTAFGVSLGVYGTGTLLSGRGTFLGSLAGVAIGTGTGLITGLALENDSALLIGIAAGALAGSAIGYELSRLPGTAPVAPRSSQPLATGVQVVPIVGVSPAGGLIGGLAGLF